MEQFVAISGNFPQSGIALPINNRVVRKSALRALRLYKGRELNQRIKIIFLSLFNFSFVWKLIFRKKLTQDDIPGGKTLSSFFALRVNAGKPVVYSAYAGSRKFIMPIFEAKSGKTLGVAKVYMSKHAAYGKNEVAVLEHLNNIKLRSFIFPSVSFNDYVGGSFVVALSTHEDLKNSTSITNAHLDFLKQLSAQTGETKKFTDSEFCAAIKNEAFFLKENLGNKFESLNYFYEKAILALKDKSFIFSLTKREFPFFEMMRSGEKFFVIDWEQARHDFPPLFDAFSLLMSGARYKKGEYAKLYKKNVNDLFFEDNAEAKSILRQMAEHLHITQVDAYWFFMLYLIDQLYIHMHVEHTASAERIISFFEDMRIRENNYLQNWVLHS